MKDGLYRVTTDYLCAGFLVMDGKIITCAPILKKKLNYWKTIAELIHEHKTNKDRISTYDYFFVD